MPLFAILLGNLCFGAGCNGNSSSFTDLFFWFLSTIAEKLPNSTGLPAGISAAFTWAIAKLYAFSYFLPVNDIIEIVKWLFVFELVLLFWRGIRFGLNLMRGSGA